MKHIYVLPMPVPDHMVTKRWEVKAKRGDHLLGRIQWRGAWRCYTFEPCFPTVFEQECLRDIADFIEHETKKHKDAKLYEPV